MIKLPDDVRELVAKKKRRRMIAFLLTEAAFLAVIALFGELLFGTLREYSKILFYLTIAVVALLPIFIVGLPKMRSDKYFHGVITDVHIKTRPVHKTDLGSGRPNSARFNIVNIVELTVKTDSGDVDFIEIDVGTKKAEHFLGDYKTGFEVYHFAGLDGYLVIDPERNDLAYCAVCKGREASDKVRCNHCGHTLVKYKKQ